MRSRWTDRCCLITKTQKNRKSNCSNNKNPMTTTITTAAATGDWWWPNPRLTHVNPLFPTLRSTKSDCKDSELETIERQVDRYRDTIEKIVRKLPALSGGGGSGSGSSEEQDKRTKKNSHYKMSPPRSCPRTCRCRRSSPIAVSYRGLSGFPVCGRQWRRREFKGVVLCCLNAIKGLLFLFVM